MKLKNIICYSSLFLFILSLSFSNIKQQGVSAINNNSQNISYSDDFYVDYEEPSEGEASTTAFGDFTDLIDREGVYETFTDQNMETYFSLMSDYMPSNNFGSCGIVALSIILSYFDTFYDDSLIDSKYEDKADVNLTIENRFDYPSPGLKQNPTKPATVEQFKQLINNESFYEQYYDYYLIHKRNEYDMEEFEQKLANGELTEKDRPSIKISLHEGTLEKFVIQEFGELFEIQRKSGYLHHFNNDESSYTYNTNRNDITLAQRQSLLQEFSDNSESEIKSYIQQGYPVFMNIHSEMYLKYDPEKNITTSEFDYKHAVVGYAVNDDGDIICNFGYNGNGNHVPYDEYNINATDTYKYIVGYAVLIPNELTENHTRKYTIDNLGYCGCGVHTHFLEKTYATTLKHESHCECGQIRYENHTSTIKNECCNGWPLLPLNPITPGIKY